MPTRRLRKPSTTLATKVAEIAIAAPQVVAHRVTRMAMAGQTPSERDKKEFALMVAEKKAAFSESWIAMANQATRANQVLAVSMLQSFWSPLRRKSSAAAVTAQIQRAAVGVLSKGVAPVHRKAVANAKRLARTKLR